MPRQFAQRAIKFPGFSLHLSAKSVFRKIVIIIVAAISLAGTTYFARNLYLGYEKTAEQQTIAAAVRQNELAENLKYPECPGARKIVIGKNERADIEAKPNCWSGWIIISSRSYYLKTHGNKNLFIWRKNEYDSKLPSEKLLDGTNAPFNNNNEGYFRLRGDKGSILTTVEGR